MSSSIEKNIKIRFVVFDVTAILEKYDMLSSVVKSYFVFILYFFYFDVNEIWKEDAPSLEN